ncbi:MAG TPA: cob(I)yrinic acid a,c-diamide adenosyltransferase [Acidimicrobiia bacterium]|jgi:cob(I)alamin adenosyltransferase
MTHTPPTSAPEPRPRRAASVVIVNTGDGKGKSTAAFGTAMRAVARGWRVGVIQFIKSGKWKVGEEEVAGRLGVDWWALGDGFTWDSEDLGESQAIAQEAWRLAKEKLAGGEYEMVILDEITYPMNWGWIATEDVVDALRHRPEKVNVILTGRDAPAELIEVADTVTEMRMVKHAYEAGITASRGIDY